MPATISRFAGPHTAAWLDIGPDLLARVLLPPDESLLEPPPHQGAVWICPHAAAPRHLRACAQRDLGTPWPTPMAHQYARYFRHGHCDIYEREKGSWCWPAHDGTHAARGAVLPTVTDSHLDPGAGEVAQLVWTDHQSGEPPDAFGAADPPPPGRRRRPRRTRPRRNHRPQQRRPRQADLRSASTPCTPTPHMLDDPKLVDVWGERLTRLAIDITAIGPTGTFILTVAKLNPPDTVPGGAP